MSLQTIAAALVLLLATGAEAAPSNYEMSATGRAASDAFQRGDLKTAIPLYHEAAKSGDSGSQMTLGGLYQAGQGVAQDYTAAHKWLSLAAEDGWGEAMNNLGMMYWNGDGVTPSKVTALKWLYLAADNIGVDPDNSSTAMVLRNQDRLVATMTPEQVAEARRQADAWSKAHEQR